MSFTVETKVIEGFMSTEIPVTILKDPSVTFWIPWYEWERVRDALTQAMADFPEYVEKAREGQ